jgi:hypothetical protein
MKTQSYEEDGSVVCDNEEEREREEELMGERARIYRPLERPKRPELTCVVSISQRHLLLLLSQRRRIQFVSRKGAAAIWEGVRPCEGRMVLRFGLGGRW